MIGATNTPRILWNIPGINPISTNGMTARWNHRTRDPMLGPAVAVSLFVLLAEDPANSKHEAKAEIHV